MVRIYTLYTIYIYIYINTLVLFSLRKFVFTSFITFHLNMNYIKFVSLIVPRDIKATSKAMTHMYQIEKHLVMNCKKTNKKLIGLESTIFSAAALLANGLGQMLLVVAIQFEDKIYIGSLRV